MILFLLLLLSGTTSSYAQTSDSAGYIDTQDVRIPSEERLTEVSKNPAYFYNEVIEQPGLWDRFLMWAQRTLQRWLDTPFMSTLIKAISILAFILVLFLLINQISKGELRNAMSRRKNRTLLNLKKESKITSDDQLDKLLKESIDKKKYGLAVRYLYQKSLFLLRNGELIKWKADKTNHEYLYELGDHPASGYFDRLTYFYEYVDYGDFKIDENRFKVINKVFNDFKNSLEAHS